MLFMMFQPVSVCYISRRHFTTTVLDSLASYLVDLEAESCTDVNVRTLILAFRDLQSRLERII